jgi:DNA-binding transcriptional LysR family regulator
VALFDGRKSPLQLTDAGRALFALTSKLFALSDEIEALLDPDAGVSEGSVRLGSDSPVYAARLVAALGTTAPGITVSVRIGNAEEALGWLRNGEVDATICSDPAMDGMLHYQPLYRDRLVIAVSADSELACNECVELGAVANETILLREPTSRTRRSAETLLDAAGVAPARRLEFHTRDAIREAIALGLGLSFFYSAECPPDTRLRYLPIKTQASVPTFLGYVVCIAERRRTPMLRALMAAAQDLSGVSPLPL